MCGLTDNLSWSPKMIIFDKGTLGDCTQALHTWCEGMSQRIAEECKNHNLESHQIISVLSIFHSTVGWDDVNKSIFPSAKVSSGTWQEILDATAVVLDDHIANAQQKVEYWHGAMGDIHANDEPSVSDLAGLMRTLKQQCEGILIAICTSDDRRATNACIQNWGLQELIDFSICGDEVSESKLSVQPILSVCKEAQVSPQDCIVVGDTSADTQMGYNAGVGLMVGVLTGPGTAEYLLDNGADAIVPNIAYLPKILGCSKIRTMHNWLAFENFFATPIDGLNQMAAAFIEEENANYEDMVEQVKLLQEHEGMFWDSIFETAEGVKLSGLAFVNFFAAPIDGLNQMAAAFIEEENANYEDIVEHVIAARI